MGIELLVAHIHEGSRRTDAECASRQAIRPGEAKGETLNVTHRSDATGRIRTPISATASALSNGGYEVHNIGVNWPHHIFVNQDFKVVGAD
jgi:hypothetical protein